MNEQLDGQITVWGDALDQYPTDRHILWDSSPTFDIQKQFINHYTKFKSWNGGKGYYDRIMVSVSGGSDSDIMIDMIERIGYERGVVQYVYFDTGMEYQATKDHIKELEAKYGIEIKTIRAKVSSPRACHEYGVPFISKFISECIQRLQKHDFKWEDKPFDELLAEYPKCKSALRWWCNEYGEKSKHNINRHKYLKEFMISNPPQFKISNKCCEKSKKETAHAYAEEYKPDLDVRGVRKYEGGARATAYTSCFDQVAFGADLLRPLFWFREEDKTAYCEMYGVKHSRCYTQYGLQRTGCACCPFGKCFEQELEAAQKYEPKLYRLANAVFGKSYEYTRQYKAFREAQN